MKRPVTKKYRPIAVVEEIQHEMGQKHHFKMDKNYKLFVKVPGKEIYHEKRLESEHPSTEEKKCMITLLEGEKTVTICMLYSQAANVEHIIGEQEGGIQINDADEIQNELATNQPRLKKKKKNWIILIICLVLVVVLWYYKVFLSTEV